MIGLQRREDVQVVVDVAVVERQHDRLGGQRASGQQGVVEIVERDRRVALIEQVIELLAEVVRRTVSSRRVALASYGNSLT